MCMGLTEWGTLQLGVAKVLVHLPTLISSFDEVAPFEYCRASPTHADKTQTGNPRGCARDNERRPLSPSTSHCYSYWVASGAGSKHHMKVKDNGQIMGGAEV